MLTFAPTNIAPAGVERFFTPSEVVGINKEIGREWRLPRRSKLKQPTTKKLWVFPCEVQNDNHIHPRPPHHYQYPRAILRFCPSIAKNRLASNNQPILRRLADVRSRPPGLAL